MNNNSPEEWFQQRLGALESDVAAADQAAIDRSLDLAGEAFANARPQAISSQAISSQATSSQAISSQATSSQATSSQATGGKSSTLLTSSEVEKRRRRIMFQRAWIALTIVACAVVIAFGPLGSVSGKLELGTILDQASRSKSLHVQVTRDGSAVDVWVSNSGRRVRWEETSTKYGIARGSRLWEIDEELNTVSSSENPWIDDDHGRIDLLALLGLDGDLAIELRSSVSDEVVEHAGRRCYAYRLETQRGGKSLFVEAFVDRTTGELRTIAAWPNKSRRGVPLVELTMVARNLAVDETKFVVAESLSEDGRLGKIVDSQGVVTIRPPLSRRWTPVSRQMLVKPGDWLRTDIRGANAATVLLTTQFKVTAGPGSLVELQNSRHVLLHGGEIKIQSGKGAEGTIELLGPDKQKLSVAAGKSVHYRLDREKKFQKVAGKPVWLAGYEGSSSDESLGSLVAKIDGRDVPLSVGFHRVSVEIRDQIARTTIEESFVNNTKRRLEGTFYFPLPQDASISGFGMWIGGKLVEADIVEKQRAREIYEEILRQKRDPGLLEWTGGNIFKARVFPIEGFSEKRIRIVYTQVLPLRANKYRYSYGLRSELLQKTPVRELSLSVNIHSQLPIKSVDCSTHSTRNQTTKHSAQVDFSAQEYTPDRDFEVVCEVDSAQSDVVVIPHRRGDDGYFLVQLTPPGPQGNWQRELLPDGQPLDIVLMCDTSASMDSEKRSQQAEFVLSVLSSLGADDQFNIAVCDVDCHWLNDMQTKVSQKTADRAVNWLTERVSLGWTDLDRMTQSALERIGENTHVIYVGDAMVNSRGADPNGFVNRLKRLTDASRKGTFHAVGVGNSFESTVLKAIARIGGGSVRQISGEQSPGKVAFELLNEIAQPGVRDLKVEFRGLEVAAIYPDQLPNLAAGAQQILIGRYLPQGENQTGEIIIQGTRNGEPVKYSARITLEDAQTGNSFIPRLWARAHLDQLLSQGSNSRIRDEIIALSERFHIITPYTSLLVLETDEDRERYGVKRRFQMRDGEKFFADGKENATYELTQDQMKRAGDWRLGLRRQVLLQLLQLGRQQQQAQRVDHEGRRSGRGLASAGQWNAPSPMGGPLDAVTATAGVNIFGEYGGYVGGGFVGGLGGGGGSIGGSGGFFSSEDASGEIEDLEKLVALDGGELGLQKASGDRWQDMHGDFQPQLQQGQFGAARQIMRRSQSVRSGLDSNGVSYPGRLKEALADGVMDESRIGSYVPWLHTLLPQVGRVAVPIERETADWPAEVLAVTKSIVQPLDLEKNRIQVRQATRSFSPSWNRQTAAGETLQLASGDRWLTVTKSGASPTMVSWCDAKVRGIFNRAFQLGRTRRSHQLDLANFAPGQRPYSVIGLHESFVDYVATMEPQGDALVLLTLTPDYDNPSAKILVTIDTERHVVLKFQWLDDDKVTSTTEYMDHVRVAGVWWPQSTRTTNKDGKVTSTTKQTIESLDGDAFNARYSKETADEKKAILVEAQLPSVRSAEAAAAAGAADVEDRLTLLIRSSMIQKWDNAEAELSEIEDLETGKPGLGWIRAAFLAGSRNNERARQLYSELIGQLVAAPSTEDYYLANYSVGQVTSIADHNERLRLLDVAKPIYDRQPELVLAGRYWLNMRAQSLRGTGRNSEAAALQLRLAKEGPWDTSAQQTYSRDLVIARDYDAAYAWLRREMDRPERTVGEVDQLRNQYIQLLKSRGEADAYVDLMKEWIDKEPTSNQPYAQYLSALVLADNSDEADALVRLWFESARTPAEVKGTTRFRFEAASAYARGQRYGSYSNWIHPKWLKELAKTAEYFMSHEHNIHYAVEIINSYRFSETDTADRLREVAAQRVRELAGTLPEDQALQLVNIAIRSKMTDPQWQAVAEKLRKRWDDFDDQDEDNHPKMYELGTALVNIYRRFDQDTHLLPFLRQRVVRTERMKLPTWQVVAVKQSLYNQLIQPFWTSEREAEAFALLEHLSGATTEGERLVARIDKLHEFIDAMTTARYNASIKQLQDEGHPEELTRTELAAKQAEFRKQAREGLVELLASRLDSRKDGEEGEEANPDNRPAAMEAEYREWIQLERTFLDLRLGRKRDDAAKDCWKVLGDARALKKEDDSLIVTAEEADKYRLSILSNLRRERAFAVVSYLSARPSAGQKLVDRVIDYASRGVELKSEQSEYWKSAKFNLLIALDRPDDLARDLRTWIREDSFAAPWQRVLAQLQAERGEISEAITLLETAAKTTQLSPSDYAALSDWYLVADRREAHKRARVERFMSQEEYIIRNWLNQKRQPWYASNVPLPTELESDVLYAFQALFEKSSQPANHVSDLAQFYRACRDFRLLQVLPDALMGRTPQQIYPFLETLNTSVLPEIRDEAVADEILVRINELRNMRESAIDLRALDLFESMVERRASEVEDQPQPHVDAAVAALKRSFEREWAMGEVRQMARLLQSLGRISQKELNVERLRQLRALQKLTKSGTDDHLYVSWYLANALYHSHDERQGGISTIASATTSFEGTHAEGWPNNANEALTGYVGLLEAAGRYGDAENVVTRHWESPLNPAQRRWMADRRNNVYLSAAHNNGQVSLGKGIGLYANMQNHMLQQIEEATDDSHRRELIHLTMSMYRVAKEKKWARYADDIRQFVNKKLPEVLTRQTNNYDSIVTSTSHRVEELVGARDSLSFLVDRYEQFPKRYEYTYQNAWRQLAHRMGHLHEKLNRRTGELEPRLLAIVVAELKHELVTDDNHGDYFYHNDRSYFWKEKAGEFATAAEEVLAEYLDSPRIITRVSQYLFNGLDRKTRAIEIMHGANDKGLLNSSQQIVLCDFLHNTNRHAESIPMLQPIVKQYADGMAYRTRLLTAYHRSGRQNQMRELLAETDKHFRQKSRWTESNISGLAYNCFANNLFSEAVGYYNELIPLHQRSAPNRGVGGYALSGYYTNLARSYSGLGKTKEAIDAAASAVITWGRHRSERQSALSWLSKVIHAAKDLDDYVARRDTEVAKSGADSPLIRQHLGVGYAKRNKHQQAIVQFREALALQPTNVEIHKQLIKSYDAISDTKGAIDQTLAMLDVDRHNLGAYVKLAERVQADEELSERAATTLIEAAPSEAENHEALAKLRQNQDRWQDAIKHWEQVAELRALEPNGLLRLTEAQIHIEDFAAAQETINKLNRKEWPSRFSSVNTDIGNLQSKVK